MGADYYTYLYLGFSISKADFVKEVTETVVVCDHPEAEGAKFCPVCGTKANKRTKEVTKEVWASEVIAAAMGAEDIEDWDGATYDLYEGTRFGGLSLHEMNSSSMDREGTLILGASLGKIGGWTNVTMTTLDPEALAKQQQAIRAKAAKLGLGDRPVLLYVNHYCSV